MTILYLPYVIDSFRLTFLALLAGVIYPPGKFHKGNGFGVQQNLPGFVDFFDVWRPQRRGWRGISGKLLGLPGGYQTKLGEAGVHLSGGEQQRIQPARAILKNAPILVLDEVTASLGPENEIYIQQAIGELVKSKTAVIAHKLATIQRAHQIVALENGRIRERGTHDELLANRSLYHHLWTMQQHAGGWKMGRPKQSVISYKGKHFSKPFSP